MNRGARDPSLRTASLVLLLAALTFGSAGSAWAQQTDAMALRALGLANEGDCDGAIALLPDADADQTALSHFVRGQCQVQTKNYVAAVASLEAARSAAAAEGRSLDGLDLYLGIAYFHEGDLVRANEALDRAQPTSADRAEYHLYRGFLLLPDAEQSAEAAAAMARARELSPSVEPTASYFEGLAHAGAGEEDEAVQALDRVIAIAPGTTWAEEAQKAKERLETGGDTKDRWWAWARAGVEYDDNVVLRGRGVSLPSEIGSASDVRFVWQLSGGYEFVRTADWSAGVTGTYYGSHHDDLDGFDEHYPVIGFWVDRRLSEATTLRFRYDIGYAWVDDDPFLFSQEWTATLFHEWGAPGSSRAYVTAFDYDYLFSPLDDVVDGPGTAGAVCNSFSDLVCGPLGVDESSATNRDGAGWIAGADHTFRVGRLESDLTVGYRYIRFSARGSEYSYQGHQLWLGTETALPWEFILRTNFSYTRADYRNASVFPDPRDLVFNRQFPLLGVNRRDNIFAAQVELERMITEQLSASIRYAWIDNDSNVAVFDYDRDILGFYLTYRFNR